MDTSEKANENDGEMDIECVSDPSDVTHPADPSLDDVTHPALPVFSLIMHHKEAGADKVEHESTFICKYCDEKFAEFKEFCSHVKIHTQIPRRIHTSHVKHKYQLRDRTVTKLENLKSHQTNHKLYKCGVCKKKFSELSLFRTHEVSCGAETHITKKSRPQIHTHRKATQIHTRRKKHKCHLCNKIFTILDNFKRHKATHNYYKCGLCNEKFSELLLFQTHVVSCDDETHLTKKSSPEMNTPSILTPGILTQTHTPQEKHKCHFCDEIFTNLDSLKSHLATHNLYRCELCEKEFPELALFRTHVLSCDGETDRSKKKRPLICSVCNRVFHNFHVFLQHSIKHKKEVKSAKCEDCKAEFAYMKGRIMSKHKREISESSEILMKYLPDGRIEYMFMPSVDKFIEIDKVMHAKSKGGHHLILTTNMDDHLNKNCIANDKETGNPSYPVNAVVFVNDSHFIAVHDAQTALKYNDDYKNCGQNLDCSAKNMFKSLEKEGDQYQVSHNETLFSQNTLDEIIVKQETCELYKNTSESLTYINQESVKEPQLNNDISKNMFYMGSSFTNAQPADIMQDDVLIKHEICDNNEYPNETGEKSGSETIKNHAPENESGYENDAACPGISYIDIQTSNTTDRTVIKQEPYGFNEDKSQNLVVESLNNKLMTEYILNPIENNENGDDNQRIPRINDQTATLIDGKVIKQEPDDYYKDPNNLIEPLGTEPVTYHWFSPRKTYENEVGSQVILQLSMQTEKNKAIDKLNIQEPTDYHQDRPLVVQCNDKNTEHWSSSGNNLENDAGTQGILQLNVQDERKIEGISVKQEPNAYSEDRNHITESAKEPVFICKYSDKTFAEFNELWKHIPINTPQIKHACQLCNMTFSNMYNLKRHHEAIHMPFSCYLCKERFPELSLLRKHGLSCTAEPKGSRKNWPLICILCDMMFHSFGIFLQHAVQHKKEVKSVTCEECKAEFALMKRRVTSEHKRQISQSSEILMKFFPDGRVKYMFMPSVDQLKEIDQVIHAESLGGHQLILTAKMEEQNNGEQLNENCIANDKQTDKPSFLASAVVFVSDRRFIAFENAQALLKHKDGQNVINVFKCLKGK